MRQKKKNNFLKKENSKVNISQFDLISFCLGSVVVKRIRPQSNTISGIKYDRRTILCN